jgi:hypothetical protein
METLVVVRVSDPIEVFNERINNNKWSSPELNNNQIVRDLFMQGSNVVILFLGLGNMPLCMGRVFSVRPQNNEDIGFENHHETIILLDNGLQDLRNIINLDILNPAIHSIRFRPGNQLEITERDLAWPVIAFYRGLCQSFNVYRGNVNYIPPLNNVFRY